jgi:hypothetical protein
LDLQLPVQSVPVTTKVVSSNPAAVEEVKELESFGEQKTKGPKQYSENRLISPMPEGGEP